MKKVSVYIKGSQKGPSYYRIYQYTNKLKEYKFVFRKLLPDSIHDKFMPLSTQPLYIKGLILALMYVRILYYLLHDFICRPSAIVITRRVINKIMPVSFKWLLNGIGKTTPIIWDFDDDIVEGKEVSRKTFNFYSKIATVIFCTHQGLMDMILPEYQDKVILLATTDGDMFESFGENVTKARLNSFNSELRLVWVATNVNLPHLLSVASILDDAAKKIKEKWGRETVLEVICNGTLDYNFKNLTLYNIPWTRKRAIEGMLRAHIGIMPLLDLKYVKGKGGFKLVQYLSVGLPCVGSKIGFNEEVVDESCGYLAKDAVDWEKNLLYLCDTDKWLNLSIGAYEKWKKRFSYEENLLIWKNTLNRLTQSEK